MPIDQFPSASLSQAGLTSPLLQTNWICKPEMPTITELFSDAVDKLFYKLL